MAALTDDEILTLQALISHPNYHNVVGLLEYFDDSTAQVFHEQLDAAKAQIDHQAELTPLQQAVADAQAAFDAVNAEASAARDESIAQINAQVSQAQATYAASIRDRQVALQAAQAALSEAQAAS